MKYLTLYAVILVTSAVMLRVSGYSCSTCRCKRGDDLPGDSEPVVDSCPPAYTFSPSSSKCLKMSTFEETLAEAHVACAEDSGRLAQLATRAEVDEAYALLGLANGIYHVGYWVDVSLQTELDCSSYTTADGVSIPEDSPLWRYGHPKNCKQQPGLHCVFLINGNYMDGNEVTHCSSEEFFFICEIPIMQQ